MLLVRWLDYVGAGKTCGQFVPCANVWHAASSIFESRSTERTRDVTSLPIPFFYAAPEKKLVYFFFLTKKTQIMISYSYSCFLALLCCMHIWREYLLKQCLAATFDSLSVAWNNFIKIP